MSRRRSTDNEQDLRECYAQAWASCGHDADTDARRVRLIRLEGHYKSRFALLGVEPEPAHPRYVLKIDSTPDASTRWDPPREFEGFRFVQRMPPVEGFGHIVAVACGSSPKFLLTRFQSGRSIRPAFDRAVRSNDIAVAQTYAARLATWLKHFRAAEVRGGGTEAAGCLYDMRARCDEIRAASPRHAVQDDLLGKMEHLLAGLSDADRARLGARYPVHGDLAPQNFHEDAEGTLYPLDWEGFQFLPLDIDLAKFRMRMEAYALRGRSAWQRALSVWQSFWDRYNEPDGSAAFASLCYLHKLLAHLSWVAGDLGRWPGFGGLVTRVRMRLWFGQRLRWLAEMPAECPQISRYIRQVL